MTSADGHELSEYERLRLARIKKNEAYLASLGLGSTKQKLMEMTRATKRNIRRKQMQQQFPSSRVKPGEERRSSRLSHSGRIKKALVMLSYNEESDERIIQQDNDEESDEEDSPHMLYIDPKPRPYCGKRFRSIDRSQWEVSEDDKLALEKNIDDNFLAKFKEFLVFHNKISEQNVRNVMRQVKKLAGGEGIRYESSRYGWPDNCYFLRGTHVTPLSDIISLMDEGQDCENRWGRDHGNGWLISHPLKKLLLFQQFILNNPDFLSSKCKLKDYYALESDCEVQTNTQEATTTLTDVQDKQCLMPEVSTVVTPSPTASKKRSRVAKEKTDGSETEHKNKSACKNKVKRRILRTNTCPKRARTSV